MTPEEYNVNFEEPHTFAPLDYNYQINVIDLNAQTFFRIV